LQKEGCSRRLQGRDRARTGTVDCKRLLANDATGGSAIAPDSAEFRALGDAVANIGRSNRKADEKRVRALVSPEAMVRHLEQRKFVEFKSAAERASFMTGFEKGVMKSFKQLAFDEHKMVRAEMLAPGQAMVFIRLHDEEMGIVTKQRWWLVQEEGTWKLYDFEDVDGGIRGSTMMGAMLSGMKGGKEPWVDPLLSLARSGQGEDAVLDQLANGRTHAEEILKHDAPEEVRNMARITITGALIADQKFEETLKYFEEMDKSANPSPVRHYMRASALAGLGRQDEALAAYEAYAKELGWDSDVYESVANIHFEKGNKVLAFENALKGVSDNKNSTACLSLAAVAAGPGQLRELAKHFEATSDPEVAYEEAIDHAVFVEDLPRARALLGLLKTSLPKSDLIEVYESDLADREWEREREAPEMPAGEGGAIIGGVIDELKSGSAGEPEAEEPEEE
jgi:tetratricopeptide (TPR) repeat protein